MVTLRNLQVGGGVQGRRGLKYRAWGTGVGLSSLKVKGRGLFEEVGWVGRVQEGEGVSGGCVQEGRRAEYVPWMPKCPPRHPSLSLSGNNSAWFWDSFFFAAALA